MDVGILHDVRSRCVNRAVPCRAITCNTYRNIHTMEAQGTSSGLLVLVAPGVSSPQTITAVHETWAGETRREVSGGWMTGLD